MEHVLGVNKKGKRQAKKDKKGIKVVYIASPMKVKTSASEFRALVQELTGKDSDTARIMDSDGSHQSSYNCLDRRAVDNHASMVPSFNSYIDQSLSSTSSDSVFEPFEGLFPAIEGSFMGMLQSNYFHESSQIDVFN